MESPYPGGSEWRKWDLQVHVPFGKLYSNYKTNDGTDVLEKFCDYLEQSDVDVFGITDYFSYDSFQRFLDKFKEKYPDSKKTFFFNLELRLNETVNRELEEVNVNLIFNPTSLKSVPKFLSKLKVVKTGQNETPIMCSELKEKDFESATITRNSITTAFEETFGKAARKDVFLIITAANNDGLRPQRGARRKEEISDEIDKFSDGFFGGLQNVKYYQRADRYEDKELTAARKPVLSGSDAHSFDDLDNSLGRRFTREEEREGKKKEVIVTDTTWIKSDPTFEGLKQIIYEPSERVSIGPVKPDEKDDFKVIRKITFKDSKDFPAEIEFNNNLCSIIGSRSSGKSALLAYLAHSVDPVMTESMINGPGEGEEYRWGRINLNCFVEWNNGKNNYESPGNVVYIRQNYLFEKSRDHDEIKKKIEPVLFKAFPAFKMKYQRIEASIKALNKQISEQIESWFNFADSKKDLEGKLKQLGEKKTLEKSKQDIQSQIQALKDKSKLSSEDLAKYETISSELAALAKQMKEGDEQLSILMADTEEEGYFSEARISLLPDIIDLPKGLQSIIHSALEDSEAAVLKNANAEVLKYKETVKEKKATAETKIKEIEKDNAQLIEKHKGNLELESLVKKLNSHIEALKTITDTESEIASIKTSLNASETSIKDAIEQRKTLMEDLTTAIKEEAAEPVHGITFGLEYGFDDNLERITQQLNVKENTDFVQGNVVKLDTIRQNPGKFLADIYSKRQKVMARRDGKEVVKSIFLLTEKFLFNAQMEGDRIGGFSESTMTAGKRALFTLRLILAESDDTWPLLIDQPEDDLDSRSIYDEIVPFLKEKKKERQIIMVSHNANLVIGADSEQVIVANRNGNDRKNSDGKQFNYFTGSLEFTSKKDCACADILQSQGICEHACEILDGGTEAFENRKNKYNIKQ